MATRNVVLTDAQSEFVDRLVSSGRYRNASEAVHASLRLLEREEVELRDLRARLADGIAQARSGDLLGRNAETVLRALIVGAEVVGVRGRHREFARLRQCGRMADAQTLAPDPSGRGIARRHRALDFRDFRTSASSHLRRELDRTLHGDC